MNGSEEILASQRLYDLFCSLDLPEGLKEKCKVVNKLDDTFSYLNGVDREVSVLASGDPLFFGIATRILNRFPKDEIEIYPAISSMQLAFAGIKETWEDAFFLSLHGQKRREWAKGDLTQLCRIHPKIVILTGGENTPGALAPYLPEDSVVSMLQRLGYPDESIFTGSPAELAAGNFSEPNLMIVRSIPNEDAVFGLAESEFQHTRGLITKDEVRAVILHKLRLPLKGVLWDIGAGSGSVSIEAKRLSPALEVFAVEKDPVQVANMRENMRRFYVEGISLVEGEAPGALSGIPAPDRVFIGGSGGKMEAIISHLSGVMQKGIIVIAAITLQNLNSAMDSLKENSFSFDVASVSIARSGPVGAGHYMKALNPVFIIRAER